MADNPAPDAVVVDPDKFSVTERDIQDFLDEFNIAYPGAHLMLRDVEFVHGGLLPCSSRGTDVGDVKLAKHDQIRDHQADGIKGLISVMGAKYTTARHVAEQVVDLAMKVQGMKPRRSMSSEVPLYGGHIDEFETFLRTETEKRQGELSEVETRRLVYNYGSAYPDVLRYLDRRADPRLSHAEGHAVLRAEVRHGIREEMAQKLSDIVFRRTELGTAGYPGCEPLRVCAEEMGAQLGWSQSKVQEQCEEVNSLFAIGA